MVKAMERRSNYGPPEIWLADDNEDFWETIKLVLEPDYSIRCFATLPETEEALERGPLPKILLLDCRFYGEDEAGLKFLKKIRPKWPVLPIIMVTALKVDREEYSNLAGHCQAKYVWKTPETFVARLKSKVAEAFPKSSLNMDLENLLGRPDLIPSLISDKAHSLSGTTEMALRTFLQLLPWNGPSVEKLSEDCGCSVATLNLHFRRDLNMAVGDCLRYLCAVIAKLLIESGMSVGEAARKVGVSPETLRRYCHTEFGCSPQEIKARDSRTLSGTS